MVSRFKRTPQRVMPACCCMILALLLVACGGGTTSTPTPTPRPSPMPSPTPTPGLTVYTGNGYSISYPQGWKVTPSSGQVTFTGALYGLTIVVSPDPHGIADASTFANASIEAVKKTMKNPQTETLPPTTTVGSDSWVQKSITGTETSNGQSVDVQLVLISDNHPANSASTQNFIIVYTTEKSLFATANTSYFQPMLQSFKFT